MASMTWKGTSFLFVIFVSEIFWLKKFKGGPLNRIIKKGQGVNLRYILYYKMAKRTVYVKIIPMERTKKLMMIKWCSVF